MATRVAESLHRLLDDPIIAIGFLGIDSESPHPVPDYQYASDLSLLPSPCASAECRQPAAGWRIHQDGLIIPPGLDLTAPIRPAGPASFELRHCPGQDPNVLCNWSPTVYCPQELLIACMSVLIDTSSCASSLVYLSFLTFLDCPSVFSHARRSSSASFRVCTQRA